MDALKASPVALNVHCAPSTKAFQKGANGSNCFKPLKSAFLRNGLYQTHNPLAAKVSQVRGGGGGHRSVVRMAETAAGNYATALAELAQSDKTLDYVNSDMEKLSQFLTTDKMVIDFLANPIVDPQRKKGILEKIADEAKFQPKTLNFLYILVDNKRIDLIEDIIKEFELVYNQMTDTELAIVTSVVKLENRHLAEIAKKVQSFTSSKNVRLKTVIDPSLIAGFTIRFGSSGSNFIDMSVRAELEKLASQIGYKEKIELVS
uniref:TSA: Wollemia nobilis Ref_Wollemi_Transcript_4034_1016 transcribed RNA sequence n=1 Tax=Wollemia nobilis TaxID=56998 RepID=A0A0C9RYF5_9CONI